MVTWTWVHRSDFHWSMSTRHLPMISTYLLTVALHPMKTTPNTHMIVTWTWVQRSDFHWSMSTRHLLMISMYLLPVALCPMKMIFMRTWMYWKIENTRRVSLDIKFTRQYFVEVWGWPSDSTCILEAEPGKLDIIRLKPGVLFIIFYKLVHSLNYCDNMT